MRTLILATAAVLVAGSAMAQDDTARIQQIIDDAAMAGKHEAVIPSGTWHLRGVVCAPRRFQLLGESDHSTIFVEDGGTVIMRDYAFPAYLTFIKGSGPYGWGLLLLDPDDDRPCDHGKPVS